LVFALQKPAEYNGVRRTVAEATLVVANGGEVLVSVWDSAIQMS